MVHREKHVYMKTNVTTATIRELVMQLMANSTHTGQWAVAGGTVPWLISGRDAGRFHSDLDLVAPASAMPAIRNWLRASGNYSPCLDSWVDGHASVDYGLYAIVAGVLVNIAPFVESSTVLYQYNCSFAALGDADACVQVTMPALTVAEYVVHRPWHTGTLLSHFPLALVKATKRISNRPKDVLDIAEIDRLGVDADRVDFYQQCLAKMEIVVTAHHR
jgi:hypothetical protein